VSSSVLSSMTSLVDDGGMDGSSSSSSSPRAGGPSRRRSFTPAQKLEHLAAYEAACEHGEGGAYLRREGLYSSLISEWRRLRDAGVLEGKDPGTRVGRPSAEQAEIGRLRRELADRERRLATTETALQIMGKAHALLEQISESAETEQPAPRRRKR
jgi:transposase